MLDLGPQRAAASASLFAAAAVWPSALCALSDAAASPLQRAALTAICGTGPQGFELLGHCLACWAGVGVLALAGALVWAAPRLRAA